ncbi:MAG: aspartate ammonia-lyase, partial [Actinomycetota bacterium]
IGSDVAVALAVQAGQLELNVMMPTMAWNVLHSAEILKNTARALAGRCIPGIEASLERCSYFAGVTVALAAALNPYIGYSAAADLARESVRTGRTILELAREKKLLDDDTLRQILDPQRMTEPTVPVKPKPRG